MGLSRGRLRSRVSIMRAIIVINRGEPTSTGWDAVATIWAEVIGQNGREALIAQALQGISVYRVTIDFRTDIGPADQLRYGAIDLNIRSIVDPDDRHEQLVILADTDGAQKTS